MLIIAKYLASFLYTENIIYLTSVNLCANVDSSVLMGCKRSGTFTCPQMPHQFSNLAFYYLQIDLKISNAFHTQNTKHQIANPVFVYLF